VDFDNLSRNALFRRGAMNLRAAQEAQRVLRTRDDTEGVRFLTHWETIFKKTSEGVGIDFWRHTGEPKASSWLNTDVTLKKCADCGTLTCRRVNGYHQCNRCAAGILDTGSHTRWRQKLEQERAKKKAVPENTEGGEEKAVAVIAEREAAFSGFEGGVAAANAELFDVGRMAYAQVQTGPMATAVAELKHEVQHAA